MTRMSVLFAALAAACAPEIAPEGSTSTPVGEGEEVTADGAIRVVVDATSEEDWIGYAFDGSGILGAGVSGDVDLQRYKVRLGDGVQAAMVTGSFDSVTEVPTDGWSTDRLPAVDDADFVFNAWYDYDNANHTLSPAKGVLVLDE